MTSHRAHRIHKAIVAPMKKSLLEAAPSGSDGASQFACRRIDHGAGFG
jgi:hypothetical protein